MVSGACKRWISCPGNGDKTGHHTCCEWHETICARMCTPAWQTVSSMYDATRHRYSRNKTKQTCVAFLCMYQPNLCLYVQPKEKSPCSLQGSPTKAHRLVCHGAPSQSLAEEVSPLPPHALLVQSGEELVQPRQAPRRLGGAVTTRHLCTYIHEIYHDIHKM